MDDPAALGDTRRAMSQENVEAVRRLFEAVGRGDMEDVIGCATEDGVIDASRRLLGGRSFAGHERATSRSGPGLHGSPKFATGRWRE